jgi:hypothetical protein
MLRCNLLEGLYVAERERINQREADLKLDNPNVI